MHCPKYSYSYKLSRINLTQLKTSFTIRSSDPWIETCGVGHQRNTVFISVQCLWGSDLKRAWPAGKYSVIRRRFLVSVSAFQNVLHHFLVVI